MKAFSHMGSKHAAATALSIVGAAAFAYALIWCVGSRPWIRSPQAGEVWVERDLGHHTGNPFREPLPLHEARVLEIRDGWIQYEFRGTTQELMVSTFKVCFKRQ